MVKAPTGDDALDALETMYWYMRGIGVMAAEGSAPQLSVDIESSSNQKLSMGNSDWGTYDRSKFAISCWIKRESTGGFNWITAKAGTSDEYQLYFDSSNNLFFASDITGIGASGYMLRTNATYTSTTLWYHIYAIFDLSQGAGDKQQLWVNGTRVTSFAAQNERTTNVNTTTGAAVWGAQTTSSGLSFDGLIYQPAFFSGQYPTAAEVYNGGTPKYIGNMAGLYSMVDADSGITADLVKGAAAWTNNNSAVTSATIPG